MTTWVVILAVGVGSYLLRSIPVLAGGRWSGLHRVEREIAHAGTAALAAGLVVAVPGGSMLRVLVAGVAANAAVVLVLVLA